MNTQPSTQSPVQPPVQSRTSAANSQYRGGGAFSSALTQLTQLLLLCTIAVVLTACGSSNSGSSSSAAAGFGVTVHAAKVATSNCVAFAMDNPNTQLTAQSNPDGVATFSSNLVGNAVIQCAGGTYTDEASGLPATLTSTLTAVVATASNNIMLAVTPLTQLAFQRAGGSNTATITATIATDALLRNGQVGRQFGLAGTGTATADVTTLIPTDLEAPNAVIDPNDPNDRYAIALAVISQIGSDTASVSSSTDTAAVIDFLAGTNTAAIQGLIATALTNLEANTNTASVVASVIDATATTTIRTNNSSTVIISSITLTATPSSSVAIGSTTTVQAEATPANALDPSVAYSSSNPAIARVDVNTGVVTGVIAGTAIITATANDNNTIMATISITVEPLPAVMNFNLEFTPIKGFSFTWQDDSQAEVDHYELLENPDGNSGFSQVGADIAAGSNNHTLIVPLYQRVSARYRLASCPTPASHASNQQCSETTDLSVTDTLVDSIGYIKASNTDAGDQFGRAVSLSANGTTLAVGTSSEDSDASGINTGEDNNDASAAGAVYVFTRDSNNNWTQTAYVKASNTDAGDQFGRAISLSDDGDTLAVGAADEDSNATGINTGEDNNAASGAGAVYVFTRDSNNNWTQTAYVKASNTDAGDRFGTAVSLSANGDTLAVGAADEASNANGINTGEDNNAATFSGAAYVFTLGSGSWTQQAYIKASNTDANDRFGTTISLSANGTTLAVGASSEDSNASGINTGEDNNAATFSGAVYVFTHDGSTWRQQAYVKASNTGANDRFGGAISLDEDGDTLAVGAVSERSSSRVINSGEGNNAINDAGAVYVFTRDSNNNWTQQAYIKASNTDANDRFGTAVSLNDDGDTLAVGATDGDSNAAGIGGGETDNTADSAGAVYVFTLDSGTWRQQAYVKASNTQRLDRFGTAVSLSDDGDTLAVGAADEDSNASGVDGDQTNEETDDAGAVYLY